MYTFYNEMKGQIIDYSRLTQKAIVTDIEIKQLEPYVNAPQEYKEDFDGTVFGIPSKGVSKPKTKALTSPYSSGHSISQEVLEETSPNIEEPVNVSPYYSINDNIEKNNILPFATTQTKNIVEENTINQQSKEVSNIIPFPTIETKTQTKESDIQKSPYYYVPAEVDPIDYLVA